MNDVKVEFALLKSSTNSYVSLLPNDLIRKILSYLSENKRIYSIDTRYTQLYQTIAENETELFKNFLNDIADIPKNLPSYSQTGIYQICWIISCITSTSISFSNIIDGSYKDIVIKPFFSNGYNITNVINFFDKNNNYSICYRALWK